MSTTIGIDPAYAKPIAYAYMLDRKWVVGDFDFEDFDEMLDAFSTASAQGVTHCVIEDGFIGVNRIVAQRLAQVRGFLEACAKFSKLPVQLVYPATWQAACLCQGSWHPKKHAEIIRQTILRARSLTGRDLPEDHAVAVVLADWGDCNARVKG